jgi:hypothetical protein
MKRTKQRKKTNLDVVAAERLHGHGVVGEPDLVCGAGGLGPHDGAHEGAVLPVERLEDQRDRVVAAVRKGSWTWTRQPSLNKK